MELGDIKKEVDKLAVKINASDSLLPTYGYSKDGAWPHIEIHGKELHYVAVERGQELSRLSTFDMNQLLYWIFSDVSFSIAGKYELAHREKAKDFRRIMFAKQEELLGVLNNEWRESKAKEHQEILKRHPFDDFIGLRVEYIVELRREGYPEQEINKIAYEKYPSNKSGK